MKKQLATAVLLAAFLTGNSYADRINFNRDIRPILSDRCFQCHGPSAKDREANLRLDRPDGKEGSHRTHEGSTAIKPGNLTASELWHRISTDDEDERMPPEEAALTEDQIKVLERWIAQGAVWEMQKAVASASEDSHDSHSHDD